jgi:hypothetical protein
MGHGARQRGVPDERRSESPFGLGLGDDPVTGAATKLTGMGRMSHEQEALAANGAWYLTDDGGDPRFVYRFVPDSASDLMTGALLYQKADARPPGRGVRPRRAESVASRSKPRSEDAAGTSRSFQAAGCGELLDGLGCT